MTSPYRVCLVTPGHLATNPRVVKEAVTLHENGFQVTVIHGDYIASARSVDESLTAGRWQRQAVAFGPAQPSRTRYFLQSACRAGARRAFQLGLRSPGLAAAALSSASPGLASAAAKAPADLYIAHYVAALPAAMSAARLHRARFSFDAEDFHQGDPPDSPEHALERRLIRAVESATLTKAAYLSAASPGIADAYAAAYHVARPTVILNAFPKGAGTRTPTARGEVLPSPTLYWFSQTIGPNRGLECAIDALAAARTRPHLHLRGNLATGYGDFIRSRAAALGVGERVHLHASAPPEQMVRLASVHDAGLVSETGLTQNRRIALTNKQFTYLLAGIPVLMSDVPAHRDFAAQTAGASFLYRTDDPSSLAERMDHLFGDPERLSASRACALELGLNRYNWECEAPIFLACVERALAGEPVR